ncbi:MAG: hypothetical protein ACRDI2_08600, partial [Chloroflexota bacterium]
MGITRRHQGRPTRRKRLTKRLTKRLMKLPAGARAPRPGRRQSPPRPGRRSRRSRRSHLRPVTPVIQAAHQGRRRHLRRARGHEATSASQPRLAVLMARGASVG